MRCLVISSALIVLTSFKTIDRTNIIYQNPIDSIIKKANSIKVDTTSISAQLDWGEKVFAEFPDSSYQIWKKSLLLIENQLFKNKGLTKTPKLLSRYEVLYATALFNIGSYYQNINNIQQASENYFKSLKLFEKNNNLIGIGCALNNIGYVYQYYQSNYELAMKNYKQSFKLFEKAKDSVNMAVALQNIANTYKSKKEFKKALGYSEQSVNIYIKIKDTLGIASSNINLSTLYYEVGDKKSTKNILLESLSLLKGNNVDIHLLSNVNSSLGFFYYKEKQYQKALTYAFNSYEQANSVNYFLSKRKASNLIQKIYRETGSWKEALKFYEIYIITRDSIEKGDNKNAILKQQLQYDYEKQVFEDSLKFAAGQMEKDFIIKEQNTRLSAERTVRNSIILLLLLVILSAWLLYKRYTQRVKQKQNQMQINALESEQKLLRAQMNPHFIFNTLNSIQSFILENETRMARNYLVKFSQLVRSILEQTRKSEITVVEEIETLKLYVEMEQLRFNDRIAFEIDTNKIQHIYDLKIPPFIIQPFVENAIIHGLRNKEGLGKIQIKFNVNNNVLECLIIDNGIGIDQSLLLYTREKDKKASIAIELAEKRLKGTSRNGKTGRIQIRDLASQENFDTGTEVKISIPYQAIKP